MRIRTRTGLVPSPTKKIRRIPQETTIQMAAIARPAPFVLKPLAGLYNPFAPGCSLLCNHPTDIDSREIIRNAKDILTTENKNIISTSEAILITTSINNLDVELNIGGEQLTPTNIYIPQVESVPEELFRRYTDTDSRPQTPAPTLVSGITRLSTSRRCVTPDPVPTCPLKERKKLILDLRRSHSQETLSIYGSSPFYQDPPQIRIYQALSNCGSVDDLQPNLTTGFSKPSSKRPGSEKNTENTDFGDECIEKQEDDDNNVDDDDDDNEFVKRRGKRRRKKTRDASRGPTTFQASIDPETQVATIGPDSHNPSARHSLAPETCTSPQDMQNEEIVKKPRSVTKRSNSLDIDSYLTKEILKQLRRELDEITVDSELKTKRKKALEEAFKTVVKDKPACEELALLQKELKVSPVNVDLWLTLPRTFTRSSAIFQLPMDSRTFNNMSPLEYVKDNINITSSRKLLYNCIFEKYKIEIEESTDYIRQLDNKNLRPCLDLVMGKPLNDNNFNTFKDLVKWSENEKFNFKICCGIFALCERILAPAFCTEIPDRKEDPPHEIETADFLLLEKKLQGREISENLKQILYSIKNL